MTLTEALSFIDIDECAVLNGGCHQVCTNTEGSIFCSCDNGFRPMSDGVNCEGNTGT